MAQARPSGDHRPSELRVHRDGIVNTSPGAEAVELCYRTLDTPVGELLVVRGPEGLFRIAFDIEGLDDVLTGLARTVSPRIRELPGSLDGVARELEEYFAGARRTFDLAVDPSVLTGFRGAVQSHLPRIGYGRTVSYKEVAEQLGRPGAVRAVGSACATNPVPIVLPCHRVVRSDGGLGGYRGGLAAKKVLLALEAR